MERVANGLFARGCPLSINTRQESAAINTDSSVPDVAWVTRAVVWNQALWTAGYSLTTGGFLTYFGYELGADSRDIALILVIPETVGVLALSTRWFVRHLGNRKTVWIAFSLTARFVSLGIPLLAFPELRLQRVDPLWQMSCCLALSQAVQAVAYVAYISWLSDLVPEIRWGRFFAQRNISKLCVLLVVPVLAGYGRDWWNRQVNMQNLPPEWTLWAYVAAFVVGITLLLASMLPLLRLPNVPVRAETAQLPEWRCLGNAWKDRSLRYLFIHNWWLALANGLTQAAFFGYLFKVLDVGLGTFYMLLCVMNLVKIPVSSLAGRDSDRVGNKMLLFWSLLTASMAMPFWLMARADLWQPVIGAYVLWGAFAAANITGRNLVLKLSPRGDNASQLALFRMIGGLLAGLSGLMGGLWLDSLLDSEFLIVLAGFRVEGYQLLFLISWIGRITAVFWILPIREPDSASGETGAGDDNSDGFGRVDNLRDTDNR